MSPDERIAARNAHRAARAGRIRSIRHRVAAGAVATFLAAFGVIAAQGGTGTETSTKTTATKAVTTTAATQVAAVTTQQS